MSNECTYSISSPKTEAELLTRCQDIAGLSFFQLAARLNIAIPSVADKRKGLIGQAIERALGANAGSQAVPDFCDIDVELKTIPLNKNQIPAESTFVTTIPLLTIQHETWLNSSCFNKLKRILWVPIEGDKSIDYLDRRIGMPFLWSPNANDLSILEDDWTELTSMLVLGQLEEISASLGKYLQIRPKGQNAKSLCDAFGQAGNIIQTLPRGFYLRASFTSKIIQNAYLAPEAYC